MFYIVYETTNIVNGNKYRGIHQTKDLDDGYLGSGTAITHAIKKYGRSNFSRVILEYCSSFDELLEREKFYVDADWVKLKTTYNIKTGGQSAGILSDESKRKISDTLKEKYASGEIQPQSPNKDVPCPTDVKQKISLALLERYATTVHHLKGKRAHNKGQTGKQTAWNKGKKTGPMSEDSNKKKSVTLRELYSRMPHHSIGKNPWNKGKKGSQKAWNDGIILEKFYCPLCGKIVDIGNRRRWHLDNCKNKKNMRLITLDESNYDKIKDLVGQIPDMIFEHLIGYTYRFIFRRELIDRINLNKKEFEKLQAFIGYDESIGCCWITVSD